VGLNISSGSISNSYSTSSVTSQCANAQNLGGLVGENYISIINQCYSTGAVSSSLSSQYIGGLVGRNQGGVNCCFWDTETSGQTTSIGGTGKTTVEMKTLSTFTNAGWDFTSVWGMALGQYPELFIRQAGDLNLDARVDMSDLMILSQHWLEGT
jgi:hypothetical protein